MSEADEVIVVGRIGAAHGVRGWLHLTSFTDPPGNLAIYRPLWIKTKQGWESLEDARIKNESRPGKTRLLIALPGVVDRNGAQLQRGLEIGVRASDLPEPEADSFYWRDLMGLEALSPSGEALGSVREVLETPAHAVLVLDLQPEICARLQLESPEMLVPFVREFTQSIDLQAKTIVIDWPAVFDPQGQ